MVSNFRPKVYYHIKSDFT